MSSLERSAPRAAPAGATVLDGERRLRILVLHQHYWPEIAATAQILTDLCEDLSARGHAVTVVCGQPSYRVLGPGTILPRTEVRHGVSISRVWSYLPRERTIPRRLLHYGSYFAASLIAALARTSFDVAFVMSTPPLLLGISGALLQAIRGIPFVYSVQDLYPDIALHLGVLRQGSAIAVASEEVARQCYRSAAALVALSDGMARSLVAKGVPEQQVHVIPNWADTATVTPHQRDNGFAREHGLADSFVVQYAGNLGLSQGLESVIDAAALLRDLPIRFALIGDGNAKERLLAAAAERGLENVLFIPPQRRALLPELLASCDVGLVTMKRGVAQDLVPSKLYGIMAASRPVVAAVDADSEVARVLRLHGCGWVVEPESGVALANAILAIFKAPAEERVTAGRNGRNACQEHYSRASATEKYTKLLSDVVRRSTARKPMTRRG